MQEGGTMPLVRIDLMEGKSVEYRREVGDGIYRAMVEAIGVPEGDRFQVITEHTPDTLVYDPRYLDIERSDDVLFIQITLNVGRTLEQKKALYARLVQRLSERPGVRPEDVVVNLVEVPRENWSWGNGEAQYA
jgi:phenylpyruvate tautomerase PptA (4-oxalocrotonate tautomerase family)